MKSPLQLAGPANSASFVDDHETRAKHASPRARPHVFCAVRMPGTPTKLVRKRLDAAGVTMHLADIAATGSQLEVRTKDATARMSDPTSESLDALAKRLVAGELAGLQIRFFADGAWWSDTLLRAADGFRLVRLREGA